MGFEVSDELLGSFVPILVYWVYSGIYVPLGSLENYRLHSKKDEDDKNLVSKGAVVKGVLLQQVVQAVVAILLFTVRISLFHIQKFLLFVCCLMFWWIVGHMGGMAIMTLLFSIMCF